MQESLELLKRKIAVLDYLIESKSPRLSTEKGIELAGDYWIAIRDSIAENCKADYGKDFLACIWKDGLKSYKARCTDETKRIENERYDRKLRNKDHKTAITANIIAIIAFLLSLFAATGIPQIWFKDLRLWLGLEE